MLPAAFLLVFLDLSFMLTEPFHHDGVAEFSDRAVCTERGAFQFPHSVISHHQAYRLQVFDALFRAERSKCQSIKFDDSMSYHFDSPCECRLVLTALVCYSAHSSFSSSSSSGVLSAPQALQLSQSTQFSQFSQFAQWVQSTQ